MIPLHPVASLRTRSKPLAACIAALCGLSASSALAAGNVWNVTSCNDDGDPGTLRNIIGAPTTVTGDTVDLSSLACSTISLAAGKTSIIVQQTNLHIQNTGNDRITVDGSALQGGETNTAASRIFTHAAPTPGTLTIQGVNLTGGHVYHLTAGSFGGCIRSVGNVELIDSTVSSCSIVSKAPATGMFAARGGGIYAAGNVSLTRSSVSGNSAVSTHYNIGGAGIFALGTVQAAHGAISGNHGQGSHQNLGGGIDAAGNITLSYSTVSDNTLQSADSAAYGGGIYTAAGSLTVAYSTISGNSAASDAGLAAGGAIFAQRDVTLSKTTVSGNYSSAAIGGVAAFFFGASNTNKFTMTASTISGNGAAGLVGGIGVNAATTKIYNSTIAFNIAAGASANGEVYGPGLALNAAYGAMSVTLSSSLLSNNTYGADVEGDLSTANTSVHAITFNAAPANNLIRTSFVPPLDASQLPDDTLSGSCPLLGPLRRNGGPTLTHALLSTSIAIDHGNNAKNLDEDQRGLHTDTAPFPFPRVSGAFADIGAYEVKQADIVFNGGFDGCPDLN